MADILDWLRMIDCENLLPHDIEQAANEIERLRAEIERLTQALEQTNGSEAY